MSDIVQRLRHQDSLTNPRLYDEAADEIERLAQEIKQLQAERDKYKGVLRYLAGEGITAAQRALDG